MCYECVDFSTIYREWMESGGLQKWRYDRRCGSSFPLPDGSSAECDPTGHSPCCNNVLGKCGNTAEYCSCYNCEDFKFTKEWIESGGKIRWRYDGRCGRFFRLPDHAPAQCDPDGANPCCNSTTDGQCGYSPEHCSCEDCVNYMILQREWTISSGSQKWRYDGRCGRDNPLVTGTPAQCNPDGINPCCDNRGWCGNRTEDCLCRSCVDYKYLKDWTEGKVRWKYNGRCGNEFPLPDGTPAQCDPDSESPCCSDISGGYCGNTTEQCFCENCTDYGRINKDWRESAGKKKWRYDGKCGIYFPLPDGSPAQCNPDGVARCCSDSWNGECGNTADHCLCEHCSDHREWRKSGGVKKWRQDERCGSYVPLPDGTPSQCDPDGDTPCCNINARIGGGYCRVQAEIECLSINNIDYRLVKKIKESGQNCTIVRLQTGFLKYVCFDETMTQIKFKCLQSDVYFELKANSYHPGFSVSKVCTGDPHVYQACGFSTKISNSDTLCGGYICARKKVGSHFHDFIECEGDDCKVDRRHCGFSSNPAPAALSTICDDKCDSWHCKDESKCNGYNYGVECDWHDGHDGDFLPAYFVCIDSCRDQKQNCNDSYTKKCTHYSSIDENITVPILNNSRCSVFDLDKHAYPYCLDYSDQTNCSDTKRVGGICTIGGHESTVSKFMMCKDHDSVTDLSITLCDDGIQKNCLYLEYSDCQIHKHKMCDGVGDCPDRGDEAHDMCHKMTSPSRFSCTRSFNIEKRNSSIPVSWIMDGVNDCLDGSDENFESINRSPCNYQQIHLDEQDCLDYFICPRTHGSVVFFEQLCDGVESCGGEENIVCRIARDFPDIPTIASSNNAVRDVCSIFHTTCELKEFKRPWGEAFGELTMELLVPTHKVDCAEMFGDYYLYLSCMNLCSEAKFTCPLEGENRRLEYDSCPGQYSDRSYTLANNSFLTFLEEAENGQYHQDFYQCNNSKCIEYRHVCNLVDDCGDMSDEEYCANHLICNDTLNSTTTKRQLISLSQRCDGIYDCFDLSDECNDVCGKQILQYVVLKLICWLMGILAILFNVYVIVKGISSLEECLTENMMISKVLMILIGAGDLFIGLYLVVLSIYDSIIFGKDFCKSQAEWLTGTPCLTLGVISTLGSQISLFAMTLFGVIRMYGLTCKPMQLPVPINKSSIIRVTSIGVTIIAAALVIAVIPLEPSLKDYFVQGIHYKTSYITHDGSQNKLFVGFPNKVRHIRVLKAYYENETARNETNIPKNISWHEIGQKVDGMFNQSYSSLERSSVHFYGNDGVCLFKYFVRTNDARRTREPSETESNLTTFQDPVVWTMLAVNLFCFVVITGCYIVIHYKTRLSSQRSGQQANPERVKEERKMQNKIILIIVTDFLCWVPFIIISALHNLLYIDASFWYTPFAMIVLPLNSVINPLVYDKALGGVIKRLFEGIKKFVTFGVLSGIATVRELYYSFFDVREQEIVEEH